MNSDKGFYLNYNQAKYEKFKIANKRSKRTFNESGNIVVYSSEKIEI